MFFSQNAIVPILLHLTAKMASGIGIGPPTQEIDLRWEPQLHIAVVKQRCCLMDSLTTMEIGLKSFWSPKLLNACGIRTGHLIQRYKQKQLVTKSLFNDKIPLGAPLRMDSMHAPTQTLGHPCQESLARESQTSQCWRVCHLRMRTWIFL